MIVGIGIDTVDINRMKHSLTNSRFLEETFSENERKNAHGNLETYYATRFACKEAIFKAIGKPQDWRLIETLNDSTGKPYVVTKEEFKDLNIFISITTESNFATAFCVVETK